MEKSGGINLITIIFVFQLIVNSLRYVIGVLSGWYQQACNITWEWFKIALVTFENWEKVIMAYIGG